MSDPAADRGLDPQQLEDVFAAALEVDEGRRGAWLSHRCEGQPRLYEAVASLLRAHRDDDDPVSGLDPERARDLLAASFPEIPDRVGPYRPIRELGRGGMGTVYLAERIEGGFEQLVALKLLKRGMDSDAILARFERERQILAGLVHPGIARLLDGGVSDDGRSYFAMELVDGEPITVFAKARGLDLEARLDLFEQVCRAVQEAHANLVVHRDLKPSNILVTGEGTVKLVDFGIAKLLGPDGAEDGTALTRVGSQPLTPRYSAPEQVRGEPVTTATDVYALGVVLYELLTDRSPYPGNLTTGAEMARAVCDTDPLPPSRRQETDPVAGVRRAGVDRDLDAIVLQALAKRPSARYGSVEALLEDLRRRHEGLPVRARPPSRRVQVAKFVRRHRGGVVAACLVLVALLTGLATTAWQARVAAAERDRATAQAARARAVQGFLTSLLQSADPYLRAGEPWDAESLLQAGVRSMEESPPGDPAVRAELLGVMGGVSRSLGQYERAEELWRRAVELQRVDPTTEGLSLSASLHGLAQVLYERSHYDEARRLLQEAVEIERRLVAASDSHPPVALAASLDQLGILEHETASYDDALRYYQEALRLRRQSLGPRHVDTLATLVNVGGLHRDRGDLEASETLLREALQLENEVLGGKHPSLAITTASLAATLMRGGKLDQAEPLFRQALAIDRAAYGDEHPDVATRMNQFSVLLRRQGRYAEAEPLMRRVLAMDRKFMGPDHRYVGISLDNLAVVLAELGRFEEAEGLFAEAGRIFAELKDEEPVSYGVHLAARSASLRLAGRPRDAVAGLEQAIALLEGQLDRKHPRVLNAMTELATATASAGREDEAAALYGEVLARRTEAETLSHPDALPALIGLGRLQATTGDLDAAESRLRTALELARDTLPAGHVQRLHAEIAWAEVLAGRGDVTASLATARPVAAAIGSLEGVRGDELRCRLSAVLSRG